MILGFTGTRRGMTPHQYQALVEFFVSRSIIEFHHGDCVGSDAAAHSIAMRRGIAVVIHPPTNPSNRAFCGGGTVLPAKPYIERDKDIVLASDELIATPLTSEETRRSGTWTTVRFARCKSKPITLIWPNGNLWFEHQSEIPKWLNPTFTE